MFLKDGKSLFGNVGLMISIIVLIILLFFSYNKCMAEPYKSGNSGNIRKPDSAGIEGFDPTPTADATNPPPQNIRINVDGSTVALSFSVDNSPGKPIPKEFMVVLIQYDSNKKPTGNNRFFTSNEYNINANVPMSVANNNTNLCNMVNGIALCNYSFTNLDMVDTAGNPFYYKLGISAIYDNGNSVIETPYNVSSKDKMFTLTSTLTAQNNLYNEFIKYRQMQQEANANNYSSGTATVDGQYEFIKSQLGGYPSNLIMEPETAKQNLLADLVDKSMSQAILNVNVSAATPSTTASARRI